MYPGDLKYRMPAEWELHARTFVSWPVQASMSYPEEFERVRSGYAEIIKAIGEFEPVTVLVNPGEAEEVSRFFTNEQISCISIAHNDGWIRDNGPTFLINDRGELAAVNWHFNAWGGKYPDWELDEQVAPRLLSDLGVKQWDAPLIMEGGSIHADGEGTLIATEECLLNTNRNPHLAKGEIEDHLKRYLGVSKVIWLKRGLSGDATDGHVDNVACFAAPGKIVLQVCHDPEDDNYQITRENLEILKHHQDAKGRSLEIIPIEQPARQDYDGTRLTLSYLNFYIVNGGVILPVFGGDAEKTDREAEQMLRKLFPERRIRTVNGKGIIGEGGNVHCITQQMPAGKIGL